MLTDRTEAVIGHAPSCDSLEYAGGHHLALGRRLDDRLPRVGRVGDDEAELEIPLCSEAQQRHLHGNAQEG